MIVQKWLSLRRLRREQDALSVFEGRRAALQSHINFTKLWDTKPATVIAIAKARNGNRFRQSQSCRAVPDHIFQTEGHNALFPRY